MKESSIKGTNAVQIAYTYFQNIKMIWSGIGSSFQGNAPESEV